MRVMMMMMTKTAGELPEPPAVHGNQRELSDLCNICNSFPAAQQENYLNHRPSMATNEGVQLAIVAKAANAFSEGDIVNRNVRQKGNWSLMPFGVMVGSVQPAAFMRGQRVTFNLYPGEPNFPR